MLITEPTMVIVQRINSEQCLLVAKDSNNTLSMQLDNDTAQIVQEYLEKADNSYALTLQEEDKELMLQPERGKLFYIVSNTPMRTFRKYYTSPKATGKLQRTEVS